jgi:hypothetical protein
LSTFGNGVSGNGTSFNGYGASLIRPRIERQEFLDDNGKVQNARFIDPNSGDYVFKNGYKKGGNDIEQQVYLALATVKNTSTQYNLGQTFSRLQVISSNFQKQVETRVSEALLDLTSSNKITLDRVKIIKKGVGEVQFIIYYTNLINKQAGTITL